MVHEYKAQVKRENILSSLMSGIIETLCLVSPVYPLQVVQLTPGASSKLLESPHGFQSRLFHTPYDEQSAIDKIVI